MKYSKERREQIMDNICKRIEEGDAIRTILKSKENPGDYPSTGQFYKWLKDNEKFSHAYKEAQLIRAEQISDEALAIADDDSGDMYHSDKDGLKPNPANIQRSKLRVDQRNRLAGQLNASKFGNKADITTNGKEMNQAPINITIDGKQVDLDL